MVEVIFAFSITISVFAMLLTFLSQTVYQANQINQIEKIEEMEENLCIQFFPIYNLDWAIEEVLF